MTYHNPFDDSTLDVSSGEIVARAGDALYFSATAATWARMPRDGRTGQTVSLFNAPGAPDVDLQSFVGASLGTLAGGASGVCVYDRARNGWAFYAGGGASSAAPPSSQTITSLAGVAGATGADGSFLIVNDPANPPVRRFERIGGEWIEQGGSGTGGSDTQALANLPASTWTAFPAAALTTVTDYTVFDSAGNDITAGLSTRLAGLGAEAFSLVPLSNLTIRYTGT